MSLAPPESSHLRRGPAWEIATLFSDQGEIGEGEYLWLTRHVKRLVEYTDGSVEVLPVPTTQHQLILSYLFRQMLQFIEPRGLGVLLFAALRVKIRDGKFREPDIVFMAQEHLDRAQNDYWVGADLAVEIVSADDPDRDLVRKRADYAEAGIAEYWIVDPRFDRITVLKLKDGAYEVTSEGEGSGIVSSALLPGFTADVASVFKAGKIRK
jgi:Uma2 family endonuclease